MTVMKDSLEGQLDRAWAPLHKSITVGFWQQHLG